MGLELPEFRPEWRQALCEPCFAAFCLGRQTAPVEPVRVVGADPDPCCVCSTENTIYVRIDPRYTANLRYARRRGE